MDTCSGHLLLSFVTEEERRTMLEENPTPQKIVKNKMNEIVVRVREQGFEKIESSEFSGVIDIGYPVFDHAGTLVATFIVPFLQSKHHTDEEQQLKYAQEKLQEAASAVSMSLGFNYVSE